MDFTTARPWIILLLVSGLVTAIHFFIYRLLKGDKAITKEFSVWGKVFRNGRDMRQQQETDLAELHRRVTELNKPE